MTLHPFERSGLGTAPFRCVGHERRIVVHGIGADATIRAAGTCDHCGTGIADCYVILSSDGKRFVVGSSCVEKTYRDVNLSLPIDIRREIARVAREKRDAKTAAKWESLRPRSEAATAALDANPDLFTDRKHPNEYWSGQGLTFRDYVVFNMTRAGLQGREWACGVIESATKVTP